MLGTVMKYLTFALGFGLTSSLALGQSYTGGHGDVGVGLEGSELHLHAHLHENAIVDGNPLPTDEEYEADSLVIVVPQIAAEVFGSTRPEAGVEAGETLWILPESDPLSIDIPFLGIGSEELTSADWTTSIVLSLDSVTSPSGSGTFSLWQNDLGNLEFFFSSADASLTENGDNTVVMSAGDHLHFNWGFTEPGEWLIEMTASGTHNTLGTLSSTETFTFSVIPEPASASLLIAAAGILITLRRKQS